MYCPNCGKESGSGTKFCENCGVALPPGPAADQANQQYNRPPPYQGGPQYQAPPPYGQPQYYPPMYPPLPLKNAGIAAVLAFLWAGLGHIYVGQIGKGILYMLIYLALYVVAFIVAIFTYGIGFALLIVPVIFWIWQIFDAYTKANDYNSSMQQTGRAPW